MEHKNRSVFSAGILVLLAILFITLTILSSLFLKGMRLDLTENKLYTLSEGTLNILGDMGEPVNLYLYFSEDASRELPQFRSYARWVGEVLDEFVERSGGKLTLKRINPMPFTPEEDEAAAYGLQGVPVGASGETLYFGLVGTNSLDGLQMMPFLQPDKEKFLEYDLAKMVSTLSHPQQKKVGLISGLEMGPGFLNQVRRPVWLAQQPRKSALPGGCMRLEQLQFQVSRILGQLCDHLEGSFAVLKTQGEVIVVTQRLHYPGQLGYLALTGAPVPGGTVVLMLEVDPAQGRTLSLAFQFIPQVRQLVQVIGAVEVAYRSFHFGDQGQFFPAVLAQQLVDLVPAGGPALQQRAVHQGAQLEGAGSADLPGCPTCEGPPED